MGEKLIEITYEGTRTVFKTRCIRHKFSVLFFVFLICYYGYTISRAYGFTFFPDEFGYWSYAARVAGYDWSDITALGSFYSYGYSLILFPIFILFHNAVTAYRVAVTLNFLFLGAAYWLLVHIQNNLNIHARTEKKELFAAIAVLYPTWLFYARSTMVENVLVFCFVLSCYLLQEYKKRRELHYLAGFVMTLAYMYFLHMRTVGVLIAGIISLIVLMILKPVKSENRDKLIHILIIAIVMGILLLLGYIIKKVIGHSLYGSNTENVNINDYAGQFHKIAYFFTKEGMWNGLCGLAGKLVYTEIASYGLAWMGFWRMLKGICRKSNHTVLYVYVGLSLLAEIAISTIFNVKPYRVDGVVYGRYHEFIFPVLMIFGLWELIYGSRIFTKLGILIAAHLPLTWMAASMIEHYNLTNIHGYVMIGMSFLHHVGDMEPAKMIWRTYLVHIVAAVLVTAAVVRTRRTKKWNFLIIGIWALEIVLAMRASSIYLDVSAKGAFRDTFIVDKIEELHTENPEGRILYIDENENTIISIIQFMLRDEDIVVLPKKAALEEYSATEMSPDDMVLIDYRSDYGAELEKMYNCNVMNGHFILYYNK